MKCDECKKEATDLKLDRVPTGYGGTRIKQICDDCQADLQDYWDRKISELKDKFE